MSKAKTYNQMRARASKRSAKGKSIGAHWKSRALTGDYSKKSLKKAGRMGLW